MSFNIKCRGIFLGVAARVLYAGRHRAGHAPPAPIRRVRGWVRGRFDWFRS